MQLERHHDRLTVRDETVVAHEDGSTVDVMEVHGHVVLQGGLRVDTLDHRGSLLDFSDERVHIETMNGYGFIDEEGQPVFPYICMPLESNIRLSGLIYSDAIPLRTGPPE